ncbi:hypothetical protein SDC9_182096 [bioreactor metagenome]|uniref:Lipoyl-binding domain-containing protein n=1 Tax=bioreactor metagenome TaxID=1076179 RepID=A0A645H8A8_9ZZZZ
MGKLVSPVAGRIMEINVRAGQVINENDEILTIKSERNDAGSLKELDDHEEFPRYQMLYEYFACSYFTAV